MRSMRISLHSTRRSEINPFELPLWPIASSSQLQTTWEKRGRGEG